MLYILGIIGYCAAGWVTGALLVEQTGDENLTAIAAFLWPIALAVFLLALPINGVRWLRSRIDPVQQVEREIQKIELEMRLEHKRAALRQVQEDYFNNMVG